MSYVCGRTAAPCRLSKFLQKSKYFEEKAMLNYVCGRTAAPYRLTKPWQLSLILKKNTFKSLNIWKENIKI